MKDLVYKLPGGTEGGSGVRHSDPTVIAVLNTIRVLVDKCADNVKYLRESAGIERITTINKKLDLLTFQILLCFSSTDRFVVVLILDKN